MLSCMERVATICSHLYPALTFRSGGGNLVECVLPISNKQGRKRSRLVHSRTDRGFDLPKGTAFAI